MGTFLTLPPILVAIGVIVGGAIVGFFYFFGVFGKEKSEDIKTAKEAAEFVTEQLEKKVKLLGESVDEQRKALEELKKKLDELTVENTQLKELLQGKDEKTQQFQALGFEVMTNIVPKLMDMTTRTNKNVERLAQAIEKHLTQMERKQTVTVTTGLVDPSTTITK